MPSTYLFIIGTLLLSLNFVRVAGFAISDWLYIGALGFAFWETLTVQKKNIICWWKNPFLPMAALICLSAILSTANASFLGVALIEIAQQLFVITVFISLIWIMVRREKIKSIIFTFICSGVFTTCVATLDYLTGSRYGPILSGNPEIYYWGRYSGTLGHPNKLGPFLVLTVLLTVGYWLDASRNQKRSTLFNISWGGVLLVQVFGIYLSNSVTAYVGLLIGVLVFGYGILSRKGYFKKMTLATPMLFIISVSILLIFTFPYIKSSSAFIFIENAVERVTTTTAESRIVVYKLAWDRILKNPLIGVGYDQIATSGINLVQPNLNADIHNTFLQIWYTGGLLAFLSWLAIHIYLGWSAVKVLIRKVTQTPIVVSLAATVLSILVMDQFQDSIYQREKWLVVGLFVGWFWMHGRIGKSSLRPNIGESRR